ncbi:hypothetical protein J3R30DRAFT_3694873 [Lentinula aciculospora]|uniref:Uncharacterized protein n=1 Tax=Lentinula aciculospora TaxID=153920 RepID=A0A9W9AUL3_9AGAR|nr:hypothetical protein J3R30DRAFT_3694873 [Lentinula aciculospora]
MSALPRSSGNQSSVSPKFDFEPITGLLTPNEVITATVFGSPSPFNVIFSGDGVLTTITSIASSYLPIQSDTSHSEFIMTIPTMSATADVVVLIEYISHEFEPFGVGTVSVIRTAKSTNTITTTSDGSGMTDVSSTTLSVIIIIRIVQLIHVRYPSRNLHAFRNIHAFPTCRNREAPKSKIPAVIGGAIGGAFFILIAIFLWACTAAIIAIDVINDLQFSLPSRPTTFDADMMVKNPRDEINSSCF